MSAAKATARRYERCRCGQFTLAGFLWIEVGGIHHAVDDCVGDEPSPPTE